MEWMSLNQKAYRPKDQAEKLRKLMTSIKPDEKVKIETKVVSEGEQVKVPVAKENAIELNLTSIQNHMSIGIWFYEDNNIKKEDQNEIILNIKKNTVNDLAVILEKEMDLERQKSKMGLNEENLYLLQEEEISGLFQYKTEVTKGILDELKKVENEKETILYNIGEGISVSSVNLIHMSDVVIFVVRPSFKNIEIIDKMISLIKMKSNKKEIHLLIEMKEEVYRFEDAIGIEKSLCEYFELKHEIEINSIGHYTYLSENVKEIQKMQIKKKIEFGIKQPLHQGNIGLAERIEKVKGW